MRKYDSYFLQLKKNLIVLLAVIPAALIVTMVSGVGQSTTLAAYAIVLCATVGLAHIVARLMFVSEQRQRIERAKDEFLSFASHQLRTPLTTMNWRLEMLLHGDAGKLTKNQEGYVKEIEDETQRMTELVNTFLNVSRINLGTLAINPELCDVTRIIESVLHEFYRGLEIKKIRVKRQFAHNLSTLPCDPKIVRMIVQNLISNAVKYTPHRGRIAIMTERAGDELVITVADTGVGIPENAQNQIFSKLFRAPNARKESPDGNGIGLYIVKSLLTIAGGRIWFESEEHKGSSFSVALPLRGMTARVGQRSLTFSSAHRHHTATA